jgi:hypothetical protein
MDGEFNPHRGNLYNLFEKHEGNKLLAILTSCMRLRDNVKVTLKNVDWIILAQDRIKWQLLKNL